MNRTYLRGDMYYADLGRGIGSEQEGYRPVLILQNNTGNKYSPTVIVAAISSKVDAKAKLPTHYLLQAENGLELPSLVLLEQLRTIDKKRLGAYIGHLEEKHIRRINHALAVSVGLIEEVPENLIICLCPACANNFYGTGSYYLRRVHPERVEKDICTYCGQRPGFDYEVIKRKQEAENDHRQRISAYVSEYPDIVTVPQMCKMLGGISLKTGYRLLKKGEIESFSIGRIYRIPKISILQYLGLNEESNA